MADVEYNIGVNLKSNADDALRRLKNNLVSSVKETEKLETAVNKSTDGYKQLLQSTHGILQAQTKISESGEIMAKSIDRMDKTGRKVRETFIGIRDEAGNLTGELEKSATVITSNVAKMEQLATKTRAAYDLMQRLETGNGPTDLTRGTSRSTTQGLEEIKVFERTNAEGMRVIETIKRLNGAVVDVSQSFRKLTEEERKAFEEPQRLAKINTDFAEAQRIMAQLTDQTKKWKTSVDSATGVSEHMVTGMTRAGQEVVIKYTELNGQVQTLRTTMTSLAEATAKAAQAQQTHTQLTNEYKNAVKTMKGMKDYQVKVQDRLVNGERQLVMQMSATAENGKKITQEFVRQDGLLVSMNRTAATSKMFAPENLERARVLRMEIENLERIGKNITKSETRSVGGGIINQIVGDLDNGKKFTAMFTQMQGKVVDARVEIGNMRDNMTTLSRVLQDVGVKWSAAFRVGMIQAVHRAVSLLIMEARQSVVAFQELEITIGQIQSISKADIGAGWMEEIMDISNKTAMSVKDVSQATYDAISNQVADGHRVMRFVEEVSQFATTTQTTMTDAVNLVSSVLNSYNMNVEETGRVSEVLFKMLDLGRIKAGEMANDFGRTAQMAASLGVSFEELAAYYETVTIQGVKYSNASTFLTNILNKLLKPTEDMATLVRSLGYESERSMLEINGLYGTLDILATAAADGDAELSKLFNDVRGMKGVLAVTGQQAEVFARNLAETTAETTRLRQGFELIANKDSQQVREAFTQLENYFIQGWGRRVTQVLAFIDRSLGGIVNRLDDIIGVAMRVGAIFLTWKFPAMLARVQGLLAGIGANTALTKLTDAMKALYRQAGNVSRSLRGINSLSFMNLRFAIQDLRASLNSIGRVLAPLMLFEGFSNLSRSIDQAARQTEILENKTYNYKAALDAVRASEAARFDEVTKPIQDQLKATERLLQARETIANLKSIAFFQDMSGDYGTAITTLEGFVSALKTQLGQAEAAIRKADAVTQNFANNTRQLAKTIEDMKFDWALDDAGGAAGEFELLTQRYQALRNELNKNARSFSNDTSIDAVSERSKRDIEIQSEVLNLLNRMRGMRKTAMDYGGELDSIYRDVLRNQEAAAAASNKTLGSARTNAEELRSVVAQIESGVQFLNNMDPADLVNPENLKRVNETLANINALTNGADLTGALGQQGDLVVKLNTDLLSAISEHNKEVALASIQYAQSLIDRSKDEIEASNVDSARTRALAGTIERLDRLMERVQISGADTSNTRQLKIIYDKLLQGNTTGLDPDEIREVFEEVGDDLRNATTGSSWISPIMDGIISTFRGFSPWDLSASADLVISTDKLNSSATNLQAATENAKKISEALSNPASANVESLRGSTTDTEWKDEIVVARKTLKEMSDAQVLTEQEKLKLSQGQLKVYEKAADVVRQSTASMTAMPNIANAAQVMDNLLVSMRDKASDTSYEQEILDKIKNTDSVLQYADDLYLATENLNQVASLVDAASAIDPSIDTGLFMEELISYLHEAVEDDSEATQRLIDQVNNQELVDLMKSGENVSDIQERLASSLEQLSGYNLEEAILDLKEAVRTEDQNDAINNLASIIQANNNSSQGLSAELTRLREAIARLTSTLWESKPTVAEGNFSGGWIRHGGTAADTVPALLAPGEFVVNRLAARQYGNTLERMNRGQYADNHSINVTVHSTNPKTEVAQIVGAIKSAQRRNTW